MLDIGTCLRWYKRPDVQEAMMGATIGREIAVRYGENGFGRRPDVLAYPRDIIEFAKNGATSFHSSEEHWENPQMLVPGLTSKQLDTLRIGWDLVLDIDCPIWRFSKLIAQHCVELLQDKFGITCVSVKFSGNKGFHIGVPFEAFPSRFQGVPLQTLFPEAPRNIALYIAHNLEKTMLSAMTPQDKEEIAAFLGRKPDDVFLPFCKKCGKEMAKKQGVLFICPKCGKSIKGEGEAAYMICPKCKKIMDKKHSQGACFSCGSKGAPEERFDIAKILQIDTLLISSRHLYRMVYSLHEKSGLVSLPIPPERIAGFDREEADPSKVGVNPNLVFLGGGKAGEAGSLLIEAYDFAAREAKEESVSKKGADFEIPKDPVAGELFPPCINIILKGVSDGRKRSMFILLNFLGNMGWSYEMIEKFILDWNKKNNEPIKENLIIAHLLNFKRKRDVRLPPNCDREGYYKDIGVCTPDELCKRIKNPANYYRMKTKRVKGK